jgi:chemotaxis protein MotA
MIVIVGFVVVLGSIISGYLMEHGNLALLINPAEMIIIFGAAFGSFLVGTPSNIVALVFKDVSGVFKSGGPHKHDFLELLSLMFLMFSKIRKEGLISIEADIEEPLNSAIFNKYSSVVSNAKALSFICDNLKVIITTNMPPHELDELLETDIESSSHEAMMPSAAVKETGDALPGFGIVAAVLGVVLTMGKIKEPPEVIGESIGAALVGTFLGILLCYGFVGPMSSKMAAQARENEVYFRVIKSALVAFVSGAAPQIAVESGRRAIPTGERPTFNELEEAVRK